MQGAEKRIGEISDFPIRKGWTSQQLSYDISLISQTDFRRVENKLQLGSRLFDMISTRSINMQAIETISWVVSIYLLNFKDLRINSGKSECFIEFYL